MSRPYVPEIGDIVWLHFDPQTGPEQAGRRPALVLSPGKYNGPRGMMICCPMTTRLKGYPFEVVVSRDPPSAVLADQIKNLDWRARGARRMAAVPPEALAEVRRKLKALLQF